MSDSQVEETSITGRVKWFNNKAGYGFITITDGDKSGTDVCVHHSRVVVSSEQYKYLVQGEYVEFELSNMEDDDKHEFQASNVRGVRGGKLMCETRNENRVNLKSRKDGEDGTPSRPPRQYQRRSGPPRMNDDEWVLVRRAPGANYKGRGRRPPRRQESSTSETEETA